MEAPPDEPLLEEIARLRRRIAVLERRGPTGPIDPALRGQETSVRPMQPFFEALRAKGLPPTSLTEGTGLPVEHFLRPSNRIAWSTFVVFMRNAGRIWTDDELAAIGGAIPGSPALRALLVVAQLLYSVPEAYRWVFGPGGPALSLVTTEDATLRQVGPRELEVTLTMKPGYEPSRENFAALVGPMRSLSTWLGHPPADVRLDLLPDGARYHVVLPEGGGRLAWLRRAVTWPSAARTAARELREAHEGLVARYAELQATLEQLPIGCVRSDPEGRILYLNRAAEQLFGHDLASIAGRPFWAVFSAPEARDATRGDLARLAEGEALPRSAVPGRHRDGRELLCEWTHRGLDPAADGSPGAILSLGQDVTEQRRLQDQLVQARKMEAVGQLAAGVAHDFNNLLTVILGYSEVLREGLGPDDPAREDVAQIHTAAERAAALTKQLLAFSRRQVFEPRILDLAAAVRGLKGLLDRLVAENVRIHYPEGEGGWVLADLAQVSQVVLNLAVNARDAMPGGGDLTFEVRTREVDEAFAASNPGSTAGSYVCLSVADTGHGMDPATRARAFEPFFTTKGAGLGTGLGLSTVYGIVSQSGGFTTLETAAGEGARFGIWLPRVDGPREPEAPPPPRSTAGGQGEVILLVEDEPAVRAITTGILARRGYEVVAATSALDAIRLATELPQVALVLSDVMMPGMSGPEVAAEIRRIRGNVAVLFMSAWPGDAVAQLGGAEAGARFVQKPFTDEQISSRVREMIDATSKV